MARRTQTDQEHQLYRREFNLLLAGTQLSLFGNDDDEWDWWPFGDEDGDETSGKIRMGPDRPDNPDGDRGDIFVELVEDDPKLIWTHDGTKWRLTAGLGADSEPVDVTAGEIAPASDGAGSIGTEERSFGTGHFHKIGSPENRPDGNLGSVSIEDLSTETHVAEYVLRTDGSTIDAIPQQNPEVAEMDELTGQSDIGPLIREIIVNQLPPQGSKKEARGIIRPRPGLYPGYLSNANGGSVVTGSTVQILSDVQSNNVTGGTQGDGSIPTQYGGVTFETEGDAFRCPNVDSDLTTYVKIQGIRLNGADGTGVAFDGSGSNSWDFLTLDRVMTRRFANPFKGGTSEDAPTVLRDCHFDNYTERLILENRMKMFGGIANPKVDGGVLMRNESRVIGAELRSGGETWPTVRATDDGQLIGCQIRKDGNGTDQSGNGVYLTGKSRMIGGAVQDRGGVDYANPIRLEGEVTVQGVTVGGNPSRAVYYGNNAVDADVRDIRTDNDITLVDTGSPTRPRWGGVIGGGPLGGVDLSTVNGQWNDDEAVADGTSTANSGDYARWDAGNTQWNVFQPATTV